MSKRQDVLATNLRLSQDPVVVVDVDITPAGPPLTNSPPLAVTTDGQLSILLETLLKITTHTWSSCASPEIIGKADCLMIGDYSFQVRGQSRRELGPLESSVASGTPTLFFGGWRSFGSGGWGEIFTPRMGFNMQPDDARQAFLRIERAPLADRLGIPAMELGEPGGYNKVSDYNPDRVALWGCSADGSLRVPVLILGADSHCLAFTGYMLPTGGKRVCFSRGFSTLIHWFLEYLTGVSVKHNENHRLMRTALENHWAGKSSRSAIEHLALTNSSLSGHGTHVKWRLLREFSSHTGEWGLAAMLTRKLAETEADAYGKLLRQAEAATYEAMLAQQSRDWESMSRWLNVTATSWHHIANLPNATPQSRGFATFYESLEHQAEFIVKAEAQDWPEALSLLGKACAHGGTSDAESGHALAVDLAVGLDRAGKLATSINLVQRPHTWNPGGAWRLLRRLQAEQTAFASELSGTIKRIQCLYPQIRPEKWFASSQKQTTRIQLETFKQFQIAFQLEPPASTMLVTTYALYLLLTYIAELATPLRYRALKVLASTVTGLILAIVGLVSLPIAGIGAFCAFVAYYFDHWMRSRR